MAASGSMLGLTLIQMHVSAYDVLSADSRNLKQISPVETDQKKGGSDDSSDSSSLSPSRNVRPMTHSSQGLRGDGLDFQFAQDVEGNTLSFDGGENSEGEGSVEEQEFGGREAGPLASLLEDRHTEAGGKVGIFIDWGSMGMFFGRKRKHRSNETVRT